MSSDKLENLDFTASKKAFTDNLNSETSDETSDETLDEPSDKTSDKTSDDPSDPDLSEPSESSIPKLGIKQLRAVNYVKEGLNVFLTGPGGSGKSFVIEHIRKWAISEKKTIGITALTGAAAVTICGQTIHSFLGIKIATQPPQQVAHNILKYNPSKASLLQNLDMLIIDEISMLSDKLFDYISEFLHYIRTDKSPYYPEVSVAFGGIQLILVGDLAQLPPVRVHGGAKNDYCFKSVIFKTMQIKKIALDISYRQGKDVVFQRILTQARFGMCTPESLKLLKSLKNPNFGELKPTVLYSRNVDVDAENKYEFDKLLQTGARSVTYKTVYSKNIQTQKWCNTGNVPDELCLAIGTQVMLTYNIDTENGFVNGSCGMVVDFDNDGPHVLFKSGDQIIIDPRKISDSNAESILCATCKKEQAEFNFQSESDPKYCFDHRKVGMVLIEKIWASLIPLRYAWAITIHKSQSATLDCVKLSLGDDIRIPGQAYTALSRVRDMQSIKMVNISASAFVVDPSVLEFYEQNGLMD